MYTVLRARSRLLGKQTEEAVLCIVLLVAVINLSDPQSSVLLIRTAVTLKDTCFMYCTLCHLQNVNLRMTFGQSNAAQIRLILRRLHEFNRPLKCSYISYITDPTEWNTGNVQKWMLWTEHLYRLPHAGKAFQELTGKELSTMSEEEFRQRSPLCGDTLYAHLDIWKSGILYIHLFINELILRKLRN